MLLTKDQLIAISEKSLFLNERRQERFHRRANADNETQQKKLERWKKIVAFGDEEIFNRRLEFDHLTIESANALLDGTLWPDGDPLPPWTAFLQEAVQTCSQTQAASPEEFTENCRFLDEADPMAFEHLLAPFVSTASAKLQASLSPVARKLLTETAWAQLERSLAQWLAAVSAETIELEFSAFRTLRHLGTSGVAFFFGSKPGRKAYWDFTLEMWRGALSSFFVEYAALARLVATIAELWIDSSSEFIRHLEQDQTEIQTVFEEPQLGPVVRLEPGVSDRHRGGRTSFRVSFDSGLSLVYKPKSLRSEELYYDLLQWINDRSGLQAFPHFKAVYRHDHGWVEIVPHLHCPDRDAVVRYYQRAGMLLALTYCLEASDCHHENIIASGEYPVLIDMETILQHRVSAIEGAGEEDAASMANRVFYWDSVFRTALLPRWEFGPSGESYDISGLGGFEEHVTPFKKKAWQYINTDAMRLKREAIKTSPSRNLVWCNGQKAKPESYVEQIVSGFSIMYRFLGSVREELFAEGGPLYAMKDLRLRFLYRHTKIYAAILNTCITPENMRDGADMSIQADVLSRPLLHTRQRHPFWPIVAEEASALLRADIPLFNSQADTTSLYLESGEVIRNFFVQPSLDQLQHRFDNLNEQDLLLQTAYIKMSFASPSQAASSVPAVLSDSEHIEVSDAEFADEALRIAHEITEHAIRSSDGSATWITMAYYPEAQRWQLQPMAQRMYDGACGTVLFLAAAAEMSGSAKLREAALGGLRSITAALDSPATIRLLVEAGIGAGLGASSLTFSLVHASKFLGDDELLNKAEATAQVLTPGRITEDKRLDLLGGAAGALVSLLALYEQKPEPWILERAKACGEHLLAHRGGESQGQAIWPTLGGAPLLGFSHGAAGIIYALSKLARVTGEERWAKAARAASDIESSMYSEEEKNWPDFRYPKTKRGYVYQNSWCHGAPGIALGRVAAYLEYPHEGFLLDLHRGLQTTAQEPFGGLDHLCCGNLGRSEVLLTAAQKLQQQQYLPVARKLAGQVLQRARAAGRYYLGFDDGPYVPSFHQGMAGIGYQMLRMAYPNRYPSLLMWESASA